MANDSHHQNRTVTPNFEPFSSSECIAWLTVLNIEAVAIVTMNALTIIIYLKERILRKHSMYLVISLAVADMFVTYNLIFGSLVLGNLSFKHRLMKKKIFGAAVAGVWFTAALFTAIASSTFFLSRSDITTKIQGQAAYVALLFCCLLIIVVSYTSIATKFNCGTHPQHHGAIRRERKLTKTLFIVTIVSLILMMPITIFLFFFHVTSGEMVETISHETWLHLALFLECLFYGNSLINPLLYALKMPEFKRALLLLLRCRSRSEPVQVFPLNDLKVVRFHSVN